MAVCATAAAGASRARRRRAQLSARAGALAGDESRAPHWTEFDDDDLESDGLGRPSCNYQPGASLLSARQSSVLRPYVVAPWSEDAKVKPIYAVADTPYASVAKELSRSACLQFSTPDRVDVRAVDVSSEAHIRDVVDKAAKEAPAGALSIDYAGAMIVHALADRALVPLLEKECHRRGVRCLDAIGPLATTMKSHYGEAEPDHFHTSEVIYVASDGEVDTVHEMVRAAAGQLPAGAISSTVLCDEVRTLEEVKAIVAAAQVRRSMICFMFAPEGKSRFMRKQCERANVPYTDVYQPVLVACEKYLEYPPVGVPGGLDLETLHSLPEKWVMRDLHAGVPAPPSTVQ